MPHIIIPKYTDENPRHKKKHTEKKYDCKYANCGLKFSRSNHLVVHIRRHHTMERPFKCNYKDCESKFATSGELKSHKNIHTGVKTFKCDYEGCKYRCSQYGNLISHNRTHTGLKPFKCDICGKTFSQAGSLTIHKRIHTNYKPYACDYENCKYKCSDLSTIIKHKRTHTGLKPFECDICGTKFAQSGNLINHKKTHTIEGQIRRKTQEYNLTKKLKEWGFSVDVETTINAKRGTCLNDTNRYYSRLDYHVINCTNAILLIECDEDQHSWYELSCEFSRMSDVRASLVTAGYELPIYWIRYNPNGKYHIGSKQVNLDRPKREMALKAKLEELCSPDFVPDKQVNIHYMFYDLMSEELGPEIMIESDFPEHLQECVSWH